MSKNYDSNYGRVVLWEDEKELWLFDTKAYSYLAADFHGKAVFRVTKSSGAWELALLLSPNATEKEALIAISNME